MRALLTGGTGFIGRRLLTRLDKPFVLSRDREAAAAALGAENVTPFAWNPTAGPPPMEAFQGVDAVFHLAGESVAKGRWTRAKKERIRESRVAGTRHLVEAISQTGESERPRVLVAASAVGYYGDRGDEVLDESSSPGDDFLAEVCRAWETEAARAKELGVRVVHVRIGIVLGLGGGALAQMLLPFKLCVGGRLGNGRQWMPWIHLDDLVAMLLWAAENNELDGPFNGVAPNPVTNREFTKTLAGVLHRPAVLPAPGFALRLAIGEFGNVLLDSSRVVPKAAEGAGFAFNYPELRSALMQIIRGIEPAEDH